MAIPIRFRFAKGARMFELHGLIFFRIVAAVLAVAALGFVDKGYPELD